jgi:hypothetical protein
MKYRLIGIILMLTTLSAHPRRRITTGTGRNRRMQAPLTYSHTWDRSDRWFNNRWWDQLEYPLGLNTNPYINQYSPANCPDCN